MDLRQSLYSNAVLDWGIADSELDPLFCNFRASIHDDQSIKAHGMVQTHGLASSLESIGNVIIQVDSFFTLKSSLSLTECVT